MSDLLSVGWFVEFSLNGWNLVAILSVNWSNLTHHHENKTECGLGGMQQWGGRVGGVMRPLNTQLRNILRCCRIWRQQQILLFFVDFVDVLVDSRKWREALRKFSLELFTLELGNGNNRCRLIDWVGGNKPVRNWAIHSLLLLSVFRHLYQRNSLKLD